MANKKGSKKLKTDHGKLRIKTLWDHNSEFDPQIIKKDQRRFTGFDD